MRFADPLRKQRKAERRDLRDRGIRPALVRRAVCVRVEGFALPEWVGAERIRGLSWTERSVWLRPRAARRLAWEAEEAGATVTLAEAEFRICELCGRPLLGEDAAARRRQIEGSVTARMLPCGATCIEAQQDKRWKVKNQ